jgi:hypothetical protein
MGTLFYRHGVSYCPKDLDDVCLVERFLCERLVWVGREFFSFVGKHYLARFHLRSEKVILEVYRENREGKE